MRIERFVQVPHEPTLASFALVRADDRVASEPVGDHAHLALFPVLPDPVGHVEQEALEKEHERHPLVVAVVRPLLVVLVAEAGVRHRGAHRSAVLAGQREGVRNPAVRVDHMAGDGAVVDAGNGITWGGIGWLVFLG